MLQNSVKMPKSDSLRVWRLCFVVSLMILDLTSCGEVYGHPSTDFSKHSIVKPKVRHGRTKREITSTNDTTGAHHRELTITVNINGEEQELELRLNEELVPQGHTLSYQQKGRTKVHLPEKEELDLCQYSGSLRGKSDSWAAVSTCHGVKGVIFDGQQLRYIEPAHGDIDAEHFLYSHEHLTQQHRCGHNDNKHNSSHDPMLNSPGQDLAQNRYRAGRYKRDAFEDIVREPYNADKRTRYVELVLVVDHGGFLASGSDLAGVHRQMKDLANIINSVYAPLNIFIALVGVDVWTEYDEIVLARSSSDTLTNFMKYRSTKLARRIPNDNAHLLTRQQFEDSVVGKANVGVMCSNKLSAGVENIHSRVIGLVAMTIAHEMGHNFGMMHDEEQSDCRCPDEKCIMSWQSSSLVPVRWSSCSLRSLSLHFEKGLDYCLRNVPKKLFGSSTCGNGLLEEGEQCDCGSAPGEPSPGAGDRSACTACCRPDCILRANATCGHGQCCDLTTCRPKAVGTECRSADRECDLPEFCTGTSPFCPRDVHKMDATPCKNEQAYCVRGQCQTHTDQCQLLWGITGNRSDDMCYKDLNVKGNMYGNCGYEPLSETYSSCAPEHALCGRLQCSRLGADLEFATFMHARVEPYTVYKTNNKIIPCYTAVVDMGLSDVDPGLVPDGAKCGPDKMCMQQRCVSVEQVRQNTTARAAGSVCPSNCSGHGVCNSNGNCHCSAGYSPPLCALPGAGGSYDSGPQHDTSSLWIFMVVTYVVFLGIVPGIILLLLLIYCCACCSSLRLRIFKSHYRKPTFGSKFAKPTFNSFGKWFYDDNRNSSGVKDKAMCGIVTEKLEFNNLETDICYVNVSSMNVANNVVITAQSNIQNVKDPINLKRAMNKEDIVIVENYNHAPVHNYNKNVTNNLDVNKSKVGDMRNKLESLNERNSLNIPNFKDLNRELSVLNNSKMDSPITRPKPIPMPKPNLSPKPTVSYKPSVSPKPGVSPKPNRLPQGNSLESTTNEFLNQRSKLRKVSNIRNVN